MRRAEVNRNSTLRARWHPIFFGEESYAITTPGEFFLECLFHLQDRLDERTVREAYENALAQPNEGELIDLGVKALRTYSKRVGKRRKARMPQVTIGIDKARECA